MPYGFDACDSCGNIVDLSEQHKCWYTGSPLALFRVQHSAILYGKLLLSLRVTRAYMDLRKVPVLLGS